MDGTEDQQPFLPTGQTAGSIRVAIYRAALTHHFHNLSNLIWCSRTPDHFWKPFSRRGDDQSGKLSYRLIGEVLEFFKATAGLTSPWATVRVAIAKLQVWSRISYQLLDFRCSVNTDNTRFASTFAVLKADDG